MADVLEGAQDPLIGRVIDGRYRVEGKLGEGGLGVVYRATQVRLDRPVALKVLHAEHAARDALRARFEREARSLGSLQHPNIVTVIDYGFDADVPFLVMELLEGRPLDRALRAGIPYAEAVAIARGLLGGVAYAHARGVVHRDLKPGNIFLQRLHEGGEVCRVLDFGLAKFLDPDPTEATLTRVGAILGTPAYMSPEQAMGAHVDVRADVYALGIVLFELFTGGRPFIGAPAELLRMHLSDELPRLSARRPGLPESDALEALLRRATAKTTSQRYADAGELLTAFEAVVGRVSASSAASAPNGDATVVAGARPSLLVEATAATMVAGVAERGLVSATDVGAAAPQPGGSKWPYGLAAAAVALIAAGIAFAVLSSPEPGPADAPVAQPQGALAAAPLSDEPAAARPQEALAAAALAEEPGAAPQDAPPPSAPPQAAQAEDEAAASAYELTPALAALLAQHRPGTLPSRGEFGRIFDHARANPRDPRPYLVLGYVYFDGGGRTDALRFFREALDRDPGAKADARMLHEVALMSAHGSVGWSASSLLRDVWGASALPEVNALLASGKLDRAETRRLEAVRETLTRR